MNPFRRSALLLSLAALLAACAPAPQSFQATVAPTLAATAPIYTATPSLTPSHTLTATPTQTATATVTFTPSATATHTPTPSPVPTLALVTLTPAFSAGAPPAIAAAPAGFSVVDGWACGDFPCADDIEGFLQRIRVPFGFVVEHVGRLPGQPQQITYGPDGRLYATVLEDGTRSGAVVVLNEDGTTARYSSDFFSPAGLAFQPGTGVLYVSARVSPERDGGLWRVPEGGGDAQAVITNLPCCLNAIENQPNGMAFGPDGYLYLTVSGLTDHGEAGQGSRTPYAEIVPLEASILRVQPHTGAVEVFARGLRSPYDVTWDSSGAMYTTDNGLLGGPGDRLLRLEQGNHYGWPYWRTRGCEDCPITPPDLTEIMPDLLTFADYSTPRGLLAYSGTQFPVNYFDSLFVVLWNGTPDGQRIVHIDPRTVTADSVPEPFVTGLIRPADVALAPDGSLVVADFIYGHIWRVRYTG